MKAVVLNGSQEGDRTLEVTERIILEELAEDGWDAEALILRDMEISHCLGCFGCWVKTPGICVIDDAGRKVARAICQGDLVVFLTPVTFGGYSSDLKKALDRSICLISPFFTRIKGEVHHKPRYARYPRLMAVGGLGHPDQESESIFKTLVERNSINFHAPSHVAGVIVSGRDEGEIRKEIRALLAGVGVKK